MTLQRAHCIGILLTAAASFAVAGCSEGAPATPAVGTAGTTSNTSGTGGTAGTTAGGAGGTGGGASGAGGTTIVAGTGGTGETAGTGGSSGGAGAGGSSGSAGTGGGGGRPSGPSAGCNLPAVLEEPGEPIRHDLTVAVADIYKPTYEPRYYFTQIPQNFDPAKPYPVLFYGQGCGQTNPENGPFTAYASEYFIVQLIPAAVDGDTVVPPGGSPGCFQAGRKGLADSPDGPYFDQVLAEISAAYCIDMGQLYVSGWSSGAWLSNYLACARGNVIRGTSSGSGGLQHDSGVCTGGAITMIMPGDAGSTQEDGFDIGAAVARDILVQANGCSTTPTQMPYGDTTCDVYGDCAAPIAYCAGPGGHGGPLGPIAASSKAFWESIPLQ